MDDLNKLAEVRGSNAAARGDLSNLLSERGIDVVDWNRAHRIHKIEEDRGLAEGKPRIKMSTVRDMLAVA